MMLSVVIGKVLVLSKGQMRSYFSAVGSEHLRSSNYNGTGFLGSAYGLLPSSSVKTQRNSQHRSLQTPSSLYRSLQRQVRFRLVCQ